MENNCKEVIDENTGMDKIYSFIKDIQLFLSKKEANNQYQGNIKFLDNLDNNKLVKKRNKYVGMYVSKIISILSKMSKDEVIKDLNLKYLQYRGSHLFLSPHWQVRNNGVKIAGLTGDASKITFLSKLYNDKTKVNLLYRFLGGDYAQVGFIRRNILISYKRIDHFNEIVISDIIKGLDDNYYEVIVESLSCINHFYSNIDDVNRDIIKLKVELLLQKSKNFKIISEAILLYGKSIKDYEEFSIFESFYFTENHKIREALLSSILFLKDKNIFNNKDRNKKLLDKILLTSTGFLPDFEMKKIIKKIFE